MKRLPAPWRYAAMCLALAVAYAIVPVNAGADPGVLVLRWAVTAAMLATIAVFAYWEAERQLRDPDAPLGGLLVAILGGVLVFALADYGVAVHRPDEFAGLATRIDALYFALSTLLTVGFGDVHAQGQIARALLTVQMAFNFTVIAASASLMARKLTARARQRGARHSSR
ncbi:MULTISPECIES: potassium channel family protein [Glycomyces]|uniref:Ion channel n=1 Tax=Glycomyces artemisiae TaxID=1076443 RepID=A0A2T0UFQ0_9ACTN|nr:potassium channel family protein [Glycomyces artemisiae]PRY56773.1 ion channel [Glycomyces artemisiae]